MGLLPALLTLGGAVGLVSCVDDSFEDGIGTSNVLVPVTIGISADNISDFSVTRADYDDQYAEEGEFMNTLCVFVVDAEGKIEVKLQPDLTDDTNAPTGNLPDWTSDKVTLKTGQKTIYAFANWDTADNEDGDWAKLIALNVGENITNYLNFTVDDPASKVNIAEGKYIPMSGKKEIEVTSSGDQSFEVGMDRLVGKVTIAVNGDSQTDVTLGDFTFTGWADKVPLMSDDPTTTYEYEYTGSYEATLNQTIDAGETSGVQIASFYVNETTRPSGGFAITMQTDRYGGMTYTATTTRTDIPRNNIYPIVLTLDAYELVLTPTVWTSILGVDAELEYDSPITFEDNTYYITMLEVTSTFSITPSLVKASDNTSVATTWDWTYLNEDIDESVCTTDETTGVVTVTSLTATPGYEYGFTLGAEWTESNSSVAHSRLYNVKVIFEEGWPVFRASRAWWSRSYGSEMVRLKVR